MDHHFDGPYGVGARSINIGDLIMKTLSAHSIASLCIVSALSLGSTLASGEEVKVLLDSEKARAVEVWFKPGEEGQSVQRPYRILRALTDGTMERVYPDGKRDVIEWKAGQIREFQADQYKPRNIGTTSLGLYVVLPK